MAGVFEELTGNVGKEVPLNAFGQLEGTDCSEVAFKLNDYLFTFEIFWSESQLVGFSGNSLSGTETMLGNTTASDQV